MSILLQEHDSRSIIDDENHLLHFRSIGNEERVAFKRRIMDIADPSPLQNMNLMNAIPGQFQNEPSDRDIELINCLRERFT